MGVKSEESVEEVTVICRVQLIDSNNQFVHPWRPAPPPGQFKAQHRVVSVIHHQPPSAFSHLTRALSILTWFIVHALHWSNRHSNQSCATTRCTGNDLVVILERQNILELYAIREPSFSAMSRIVLRCLCNAENSSTSDWTCNDEYTEFRDLCEETETICRTKIGTPRPGMQWLTHDEYWC